MWLIIGNRNHQFADRRGGGNGIYPCWDFRIFQKAPVKNAENWNCQKIRSKRMH